MPVAWLVGGLIGLNAADWKSPPEEIVGALSLLLLGILVATDITLPVLDEDNFDSFVPMFKRQGEKLFELTAGGTNLVAQAVDVRLSSEGDAVDFTIIYPRPAAGPVRIAPAYVKRLPDQGYGTALAVFDEAGHQLAFADNLDLENIFLDFKISTTTNAPPQSK